MAASGAGRGATTPVAVAPDPARMYGIMHKALPNLFPAMERSIRETEFHESMDSLGHQNYRAALSDPTCRP